VWFAGGVVVPDRALGVPEPARVEIEVSAPDQPVAPQPRQGGWWHGQVQIAPDFNELPRDIAESFGMDDE
jgi:hypothetical protein